MSSLVGFPCGLLAFLSLAIISGAANLSGPCRLRLEPCDAGRWTCISVERYQQLRYAPMPDCPFTDTGITPPPPSDRCESVGGVCQFTNTTVNCVTTLEHCQGQYQCAAQEESNEPTPICPSFLNSAPKPRDLCVPINGSCEWYDPCRAWRGFCQGSYRCGSLDDYYEFVNGPQPICSPPPEGWVPPTPPGQCIVQNRECSWSNCTSWLNWCQTSWQCGTLYDMAVYRSGPIPGCAFPGNDYVPPSPPGSCTFQTETETCSFGQCSGGKVYKTCGTACPLTCDNPYDMPVCVALCVEGCFCPDGTVDHNGVCVDPTTCPGQCSGGKVYKTCGTACPLTCDNPYDTPVCVKLCVQGCFCPNGTVDSNGVCVDPTTCPTACAVVLCAQYYRCIVGTNGDATCVPTCDYGNGGCHSDQECVVEQPECTEDDPFCFPYAYFLCRDQPYIPCEDVGRDDPCTNARCLVQNNTEAVQCVESCYLDNGGCGSNHVCFNQLNDDCPSDNRLAACDSHVECRDLGQLAGDECPLGMWYGVGGVCEPTCESYLHGDQNKPCPEIGVYGCFCFSGTVMYRGRCVDPRECYALVNDPPPFNLLPVKPNVVLISMIAANSNVKRFREVASNFEATSQSFVDGTKVNVLLRGYYDDIDGLRILLQISSGVGYILNSSDIVQTFRANAASLPVQVDSIQTVEVQTIPATHGLSSGGIAGIVVGAILLLTAILMAIAVLIIIAARRKRNVKKTVPYSEDKEDPSSVSYAKLEKDEEDYNGVVTSDPTGDDAMTFEPKEEKVDLSQVDKTF